MQNQLILVLNCGSSSFKFSIVDPIKKTTYLSGISDDFYANKTAIYFKEFQSEAKHFTLNKKLSYKNIIKFIFNKLMSRYQCYMNYVIGIGHRVVHGGSIIKSSVIINDSILDIIKKTSIFAPIHNPINLLGIKMSLALAPCFMKKNVAVFDTVFHQTMPKYSYLYGIPYYFYSKYSLRRYGAHGINHFYITKVTSILLNKKKK